MSLNGGFPGVSDIRVCLQCIFHSWTSSHASKLQPTFNFLISKWALLSWLCIFSFSPMLCLPGVLLFFKFVNTSNITSHAFFFSQTLLGHQVKTCISCFFLCKVSEVYLFVWVLLTCSPTAQCFKQGHINNSISYFLYSQVLLQEFHIIHELLLLWFSLVTSHVPQWIKLFS